VGSTDPLRTALHEMGHAADFTSGSAYDTPTDDDPFQKVFSKFFKPESIAMLQRSFGANPPLLASRQRQEGVARTFEFGGLDRLGKRGLISLRKKDVISLQDKDLRKAIAKLESEILPDVTGNKTSLVSPDMEFVGRLLKKRELLSKYAIGGSVQSEVPMEISEILRDILHMRSIFSTGSSTDEFFRPLDLPKGSREVQAQFVKSKLQDVFKQRGVSPGLLSKGVNVLGYISSPTPGVGGRTLGEAYPGGDLFTMTPEASLGNILHESGHIADEKLGRAAVQKGLGAKPHVKPADSVIPVRQRPSRTANMSDHVGVAKHLEQIRTPLSKILSILPQVDERSASYILDNKEIFADLFALSMRSGKENKFLQEFRGVAGYQSGGEVFVPNLTTRSRSPGNVGRRKQYKIQYRDFLQKKVDDQTATQEEIVELIKLQTEQYFDSQWRNVRHGARLLHGEPSPEWIQNIDRIAKPDVVREYMKSSLLEKLQTGPRAGLTPTQYASGGNVDSVPALLTPGEFVINKESASRIGRPSLERMNKVGRFATGGPVGAVKMQTGGLMDKMGGIAGAGFAISGILSLVQQFQGLNKTLDKVIGSFSSVAAQGASLALISKNLGSTLVDQQQVLETKRKTLEVLQEKKKEMPDVIRAQIGSARAAGQTFDAADASKVAAKKAMDILFIQHQAARGKEKTTLTSADFAVKEQERAVEMDQARLVHDTIARRRTTALQTWRDERQKVGDLRREQKQVLPAEIATAEQNLAAQEKMISTTGRVINVMAGLASVANVVGSELERMGRASLEAGTGGEFAFAAGKAASG
ncbi:MAG: hypothetical protein KKH44_07160, partial [Bacteroidetes bacterium]|nr:hypothetical protein [Bacteroidota bacterium]